MTLESDPQMIRSDPAQRMLHPEIKKNMALHLDVRPTRTYVPFA